jgi:hypothetical protein
MPKGTVDVRVVLLLSAGVVPRGHEGDLFIGARVITREEGIDVLHSLADGERHVNAGGDGQLVEADAVVEE